MSAADWLIVILPLLFLLGIAVYSPKYMPAELPTSWQLAGSQGVTSYPSET